MKIDYATLPPIPCPVCGSTSFRGITQRFDAGPIVQCEQCPHIYLNPTLPDALLDTIYATYHAAPDETELLQTIDGWFSNPRGPYQYALNFVEQTVGFSGKRVLEIGCGLGRFLAGCRQRGAVVTGIDRSPNAARLARHHFGLDLLTTTLEQAAEETLLPARVFDLVFAFEVIEHVREPGAFLRTVHRLLAPDGLLLLSTPNFHLFALMGEVAPVVQQWPEHLHFFDPSSLANCLERYDFTIKDLTTVLPFTYGERQKQMLARRLAIREVWNLVRRTRFAVLLKDRIFWLLDRRQEAADLKGWNGTCVVSVAQKRVG